MEYVHLPVPEKVVVAGLLEEEPPLSEAVKKTRQFQLALIETFEIRLSQIVPLPESTEHFFVNLLTHLLRNIA